jgi:hypothetical protein
LLIGIARENHDECRIYGPGSEVFSTTVREASGIIMIPAQLQGLIAVARGCLIDIVALSQMVGLETKVSGKRLLFYDTCFYRTYTVSCIKI